jgi:hypothetical protein
MAYFDAAMAPPERPHRYLIFRAGRCGCDRIATAREADVRTRVRGARLNSS